MEHIVASESKDLAMRPNNFTVFRLSCEAGLGDSTAEARRTRSKEFLIKKFSDLCELGASVVNASSQKTRSNLILFLELYRHTVTGTEEIFDTNKRFPTISNQVVPGPFLSFL
jgi:hypothetical protein